QKGFPRRALRVDRLFGRPQGDAAFLEQVYDVLEVFDTARQAVHPGDDERVPAPEKLQQQRQFGPARAAGGRNVFLQDPPAPPPRGARVLAACNLDRPWKRGRSRRAPWTCSCLSSL